jgi:hypothetical protein
VTAAVRSLTPSLPKAWTRWVLTVASLTWRRAATSRLVAPPGPQLQHLQLALGEGLGGRLAELAAQPGGDLGGEHRLAPGGRPHGPEQLGPRGVLEQVAGGAGLDGADHVAFGVEGGQDQHPDLRVALPQGPDGGHPVQGGHAQVDQGDVGPDPGDQGQRLQAVAGLADHLQVRLGGDHATEPVPDHRMVVGDQQPDHRSSPAGIVATTVVPWPGPLSTSRLPWRAATRSRMAVSP